MLADAYSNVFVHTGATAPPAAMLALNLRSGRSQRDPDQSPVPMD